VTGHRPTAREPVEQHARNGVAAAALSNWLRPAGAPDARLAVPAGACWAAAAVLIGIPGAAGFVAMLCWCSAILLLGGCLLAARRRRRAMVSFRQNPTPSATGRARRAGGILVVCGVGMAAIAIAATAVAAAEPARRPAGLAAAQGHVVHVVARIDGDPRIAQTRAGFGAARLLVAATASSISLGSTRFTGEIPITGYVPADGGPRPRIGEQFAFDGTLRAYPSGDESAFAVYATGALRLMAPAPPLYSWANDLRAGLSKAAGGLPGDGGSLLPGLAIGDVSAVSGSLSADMKASSLTHLTAVSGANCAVVIALVMWASGALGMRRGVRVACALTALGGFVVLVTPQPSVLRAAVMATIVVFSAAAGRPGRGVPSLCLAVIVLLVGDPWLALDYGFALSVLATAGLLVLAPLMARALQRWLPRSLALALSIPIAAQVACQPILILLNPSVPLYGVAANLLAEPAAPMATVLGLLACLMLPVFPAAGMACASLAWLPSAWIAGVARVTATLPGSSLPWLTGFAGLAVMAMVTICIVIAVQPSPVRRPPSPLPPGGAGARARPEPRAGRQPCRPRSRMIAAVLLAVFAVCYAGGVAGGGAAQAVGRPSDWQLGACDIGQGDALLVRDGAAHGLVDVGPDAKPLSTCLATLGIAHIDLLVLTHYDLDHVGGLEAVAGRVSTAIVTAPIDAHGRGVVARLRERGADVRVAQAGDHGTLGRLQWRILWPVTGSAAADSSNERGLAVEFGGRGIRSLFLADLDERAQSALLATGTVRAVDVVKVAHHGSADQSDALYAALHARVGMISVGADNDYGHPTASLLATLRRLGVRVVRTDVNGMCLIGSAAGDALSVWTQRSATPAQLAVPGSRGRR
jgi:competence protein ComEC